MQHAPLDGAECPDRFRFRVIITASSVYRQWHDTEERLHGGSMVEEASRSGQNFGSELSCCHGGGLQSQLAVLA